MASRPARIFRVGLIPNPFRKIKKRVEMLSLYSSEFSYHGHHCFTVADLYPDEISTGIEV
jgi:radical SAM superfamily enzyme YgiQ (UPF0313 family)